MKTKESEFLRYADRLQNMAESASVTELLKLAERPEVISFAGGLPDPRTFPLDRFRQASEEALSNYGASALNYGATEGFTRLREWLAERMSVQTGSSCALENILVTSGGLEALNLISMALLEKGSSVVVGAPTYLVALHVFRGYQTAIHSVPLDDKGMDPDRLEETLSRLEAEKNPARLVYLIPSFQNPSGATLPLERRRRIAEICRNHRVPIVEDHAYGDLRYEGEPQPSLKELDPENVIFVHTFSKIFSPGARLGWIWASPGLIKAIGTCKLGTDQCANTWTQRVLLTYAEKGWLDDQIERSIQIYRQKKELMSRLLRKSMPDRVSWLEPEGGFFYWLKIPGDLDSEELMKEALVEHNLAVVAGTLFFADGSGQQFIRLAFSYLEDERFKAGLECLGGLLRC